MTGKIVSVTLGEDRMNIEKTKLVELGINVMLENASDEA